eukprot:scaffold188934_cov33-Cyclotella_meneghiniana.AAC.1
MSAFNSLANMIILRVCLLYSCSNFSSGVNMLPVNNEGSQCAFICCYFCCSLPLILEIIGDDQQCCASNLGSGGEEDVLVGEKKRGRQYFVITFSQELVLCEESITNSCDSTCDIFLTRACCENIITRILYKAQTCDNNSTTGTLADAVEPGLG